jgi:hypothetical protein
LFWPAIRGFSLKRGQKGGKLVGKHGEKTLHSEWAKRRRGQQRDVDKIELSSNFISLLIDWSRKS